jgi:hypothetical protein
MKRRTLLLGVLVSCTAGHLHAVEATPDVLAQVRQRLGDVPLLRGEFEQRKTLKGFKNPLVSRGEFLVARERGVWWHTREPFASTLVLTRDRLLARQADGSVGTRLSASSEPGVRAINEMLFALMAADLSQLAQRFRIEGQLVGKDGWSLVLVPREASVAQWVSRIELDGDKMVRHVKFVEVAGDTSDIRFSAHMTPASLSREDAARFD